MAHEDLDRESFTLAVIPDTYYREYPPCHSRMFLAGIFLGNDSDGYLPQTRRYDIKGDGFPITTCGDDEKSLSCPTLIIGHPSGSKDAQ